MNKKLLALTLIAAPGLMAQETSDTNQTQEQTGYCNTCCCNPCSCKPCCVPKPKKCIDCECYTPAFYDLQCDCGFFLDAEFLYWYARETNLSYGVKVKAQERTFANGEVTDPTLVFAPQTYEHLSTQWDPGFRVGVGFNSGCDGWDYFLHWTYLRNRKSSSTSVPNSYSLEGDPTLASNEEEFLINPWINMSFHGLNPDSHFISFDKINAKWRFTLNVVDLELGRKYWLSRCFNLRPYAGLRGAWTRVTFRTKSFRNFESSDLIFNATFKDRFKTRNWGGGFLGGIQPTWYFCSNFALYSNFDAALIWGDFENKKKENYLSERTTNGSSVTTTTDPSYSNESKSKFAQMNAMLDLAIGLRWEENWCCDQYRSTFDIGWEHHIWFDHNHRNKTFDFLIPPSFTPSTTEGFRTYAEATGNISYGGLVVRLRFDF